MTFVEKLGQLRTARGLTQAELAKAADVEFAALREWLTGRRMPSFAAVLKLAKALGVTCEAFAECSDLGGDQQPSNSTATAQKPEPKKPARSKSGSQPPAVRERGRGRTP